MVGGVPGSGNRLERPEARALGEHDVRLAASRCERRRVVLAQRRHRLGVIAVIVRQRDAAEPAELLDRVEQAPQVGAEQRPGIEHPRRIAPEQPGVRARQRQRPGIVGAHAEDLTRRQRLRVGRRHTGAVRRGSPDVLTRPARSAHGDDVS